MFTTARVVVAALLLQRVASHCSQAPLRFNADGTFHISVFSDMHTGEAEDTVWGQLQDINTVKVMEAVLDKEPTDLVVLNGDFITGENTFRENSTNYVDLLVKPLVERNLPWASTYGSTFIPLLRFGVD